MAKDTQFRSGRIQNISPAQEVAFKQVWAHLLKYWGYDVALSDSDCGHIRNFVASSDSSTDTTGASSLSHSKRLDSSTHASKSRSWFRKSSSHHQHEHHQHLQPKSSISSRASLQHNIESHADHLMPPRHVERTRRCPAQDTYIPVEVPNEEMRRIFVEYYEQNFCGPLENSSSATNSTNADNSAEMESEMRDGGDDESLQSFVTALSTQPPGDSPNSSVSTLSKPKQSRFRFMSTGNPKISHQSWVATMRQDLIDNYFLRFCRARKFAYQDVLEMLHNSLVWRATACFPNDWVNMGDALSYLKKENPKYYNNFATGKTIFGGEDRLGNPLLISQPRKHFASELTPECTNMFSLVSIEWTRLLMREVNKSADQTSVVFDLTGFSLKNNDNGAIKFLAKALEAYYPECLAAIYIYNAPWFFSSVWNIVKLFIDPAVAAKIHFVRGIEELSQFIDMDNIPQEMGGNSPISDTYPEPSERDASPKEKDERFFQLARERESLLVKFIETTQRWVEATNAQVSAQYLRDKIELDVALSYNYIELDPYFRCRGVPDRTGALVLKN